MKRALAALAISMGFAALGWHFYQAGGVDPLASARKDTTTALGGYGGPRDDTRPPRPPAKLGAPVASVIAPSGDSLGIWVDEGAVHVARHVNGAWTDAQTLEDIPGTPGDLLIAVDTSGRAIAVWRHSVGNLDSVRFSRFERAQGWSKPDVVPGLLPRTGAASGKPVLQLRPDGSAILEWPSAFDPTGGSQVTHFDPIRGRWTPPQDLAAK